RPEAKVLYFQRPKALPAGPFPNACAIHNKTKRLSALTYTTNFFEWSAKSMVFRKWKTPASRCGASGHAIHCAVQRSLAQSACAADWPRPPARSEEHTSELQSRGHLVCRLLLEKQK